MQAQMTVKTTLSFTDRHHHFLSEKAGQRVFATHPELLWLLRWNR